MAARGVGDAADNFIVRGTPFNKGKVLRLLLDSGVQPVGDPKQCHAVAVDARAPKFDAGSLHGSTVSRSASWSTNSATVLRRRRGPVAEALRHLGRLVAQQPDQIAYSITDAKASGHFMPSGVSRLEANSIGDLARQMDLEPAALAATVGRYNEAVVGGRFDHTKLDGCRTRGLTPEKTNWAQRIDTPPYFGYPLRPGITFTYLGVKVDERAALMMTGGTPSRNIVAAGRSWQVNILGQVILPDSA